MVYSLGEWIFLVFTRQNGIITDLVAQELGSQSGNKSFLKTGSRSLPQYYYTWYWIEESIIYLVLYVAWA